MRVGVLCEFSGRVRDAFIRAGHDAISCDLLPTESPGPHRRGDVFTFDWSGFDLLICHPPCTYLCNSGVRWLWTRGGHPDEERWARMEEAAFFFTCLWCLPCPRLCIENPIMHKHARCLLHLTIPRKPQIIQPWQFGHPESKATCLWTRNLPPLLPTQIMQERKGKCWLTPPSPDRWKSRSLTYPGIAAAMASQWGTS